MKNSVKSLSSRNRTTVLLTTVTFLVCASVQPKLLEIESSGGSHVLITRTPNPPVLSHSS